ASTTAARSDIGPVRVRLREFMPTFAMGQQPMATGRTMSTDHIRHVVGMSSKPQMIRVRTWRIVTRMGDFHSHGYRAAVGEFIGKAMGVMVTEPAYIGATISRSRSPSHPWPAIAATIQVFPEFFGRFHGALLSAVTS